MGQFKPMVKMYTTEPTVELKLKKGGKVEKKMQTGGLPAPAAPARGGMMPVAAPAKPSMMARRRAMRAMPAMPGPAAPVGPAARMMKEGGESKAEHKAEMKEFKKLKGELKSHEGKPASKAHKGLKTGGVAMGQGGYKAGGVIKSTKGETKMVTAQGEHHTPKRTGEVVMGKPGGYAKGGSACYAKGGGVEGNVSTTPAGVSGTTTGEVRKGNAGGYKKGGSAKKAYATGGLVDTGRPVAMPKKSPSKPVRITALSGTFKKGGEVSGDMQSDRETKAYKEHYKREADENKAMREAMNPVNWIKGIAGKVRDLGSVTTTERETSKTVTPPAKKRGGSVKK